MLVLVIAQAVGGRYCTVTDNTDITYADGVKAAQCLQDLRFAENIRSFRNAFGLAPVTSSPVNAEPCTPSIRTCKIGPEQLYHPTYVHQASFLVPARWRSHLQVLEISVTLGTLKEGGGAKTEQNLENTEIWGEGS